MALKSRIPKIARALPKAADKAAQQGAQRVKEECDPRTPVDTGELLDSHEVLAGPDVGHWIFREGAGLPDERSIYTEYGTATQAAQPHVTPAAEIVRRELPKIVAAQFKAVLS